MRGSFLAVLAGACLTLGATMAEKQGDGAATAQGGVHAMQPPQVLGVVTDAAPIVLEAGDAVIGAQVIDGKVLQLVVAGMQVEPIVREVEYVGPSLVMYDPASQTLDAVPLKVSLEPGSAEANAGGGANVPPILPDPGCSVGFNPIGAQCYDFEYTIGQAQCYGRSCVGAPSPDGSYCVTSHVTCYIGCLVSASSTTLCVDMSTGRSCTSRHEGVSDRFCNGGGPR